MDETPHDDLGTPSRSWDLDQEVGNKESRKLRARRAKDRTLWFGLGMFGLVIPTNLTSITDGQIYLSPELFQKGILSAIDVGRSVSRVGGKAQWPCYRAVAGDLRLAYHRQRQQAFTEELLDIVAGFESITSQETQGEFS